MSTARPEIVFFDDFTGSDLDRSAWNVVVTGQTVNDEQQAYVDSSAVIYLDPRGGEAPSEMRGEEAAGANRRTPASHKGALVLQARRSPGFVTQEGRRFDFTSARIDSRGKVEFTYGKIAARMKLPIAPGLWPAFWVLGAEGPWPAAGEIDIMESVGEADWTSVALHGPGYSGDTPLVNKLFFGVDREVSRWHVYSVDWRPDSLRFFVDDELVYRVTRPMVEYYGAWAYDNPKYLILNMALGGTYPLKTNGVKSPYLGLPEPTVAFIERGDARVLVDWVRVARL